MSNRAGNIKKILVALGISFCALSQIASASPAGVVKHYRKLASDNKIRYELELTETTEGENVGGASQYTLNKLTYSDDTELVNEIITGSVEGTVTTMPAGGQIETANVVVEVADTETTLKVVNSNNIAATINLYGGESIEASLTDGRLTTIAGVEDDEAPKLLWAYRNIEGQYIKFKAKDEMVIIDRILDDQKKDRVIIQEKDKDKEVEAKYKVRKNDVQFYVVDRLGNELPVNIAGDVDVTYTLAAKNIDGSKVVLNMTLPEDKVFYNITTVEGTDISRQENSGHIDIRKEGDKLVAIYDDVPVGTTYVNVNYKKLVDNPEYSSDNTKPAKIPEQMEDPENAGTYIDKIYTIPVELDLDLSCPELVYRDVEGDGNIVEASEYNNGELLRAYKDYRSQLAIVEVKDMISGITRIAAATQDDMAHESAVEDDSNPAQPTNEAFKIEGLPTSVVQLIKLPVGATHIRVHDGIGNVESIDLSTVPVIYGNEIEPGDAGMELDLTQDGNDVHATYRSRKAGLKKFVKVTEAGAKQSRAVAMVLSAGETSALDNAASGALACWNSIITGNDGVISKANTAEQENADAIIAAGTAARDAEADESKKQAAEDAAKEAKRQEVRRAAIEEDIVDVTKNLAAKTAAKTAIKTALQTAVTNEDKSYEEGVVAEIIGDNDNDHEGTRIAAIEEALAKLIAYRAEKILLEEIAALQSTGTMEAATDISTAGKDEVSLGYETARITVQEVDAVLKLVTHVATTGTCDADGDREYMIDNTVTDGSDNEYAPIQTTNDIKTWYPVTEQTTEKITREVNSQQTEVEEPITLSGVQLQRVPEYVAVDVFGNTSLFNLNDILFKGGVIENPNDDTNYYIYINTDTSDNNKTNLISLKVQDTRRVKKITATIDYGSEGIKEKTLETFEIDSVPDAVGNGVSTQDVDRVYEIKKGVVNEVTVYHWNCSGDKNTHHNGITQNVVSMKDYNKVRSSVAADRNDLVKINRDATNKYNLAIKYGIKRIDYYDGPVDISTNLATVGTVLEFYDEIPKTAEIFSTVKDGQTDKTIKVVVIDALGYEYQLGDNYDEAAMTAYGPQEQQGSGS